MSNLQSDAVVAAIAAIRLGVRQAVDDADYGEQITDLVVELIDRYGNDGMYRFIEALIRLNAGVVSFTADKIGYDVFELLDEIEMLEFTRTTRPE
jgi:hypothetical protein